MTGGHASARAELPCSARAVRLTWTCLVMLLIVGTWPGRKDRAPGARGIQALRRRLRLIREALAGSGDICPGNGQSLIRLDPRLPRPGAPRHSPPSAASSTKRRPATQAPISSCTTRSNPTLALREYLSPTVRAYAHHRRSCDTARIRQSDFLPGRQKSCRVIIGKVERTASESSGSCIDMRVDEVLTTGRIGRHGLCVDLPAGTANVAPSWRVTAAKVSCA
jgi:hypothetical protein